MGTYGSRPAGEIDSEYPDLLNAKCSLIRDGGYIDVHRTMKEEDRLVWIAH